MKTGPRLGADFLLFDEVFKRLLDQYDFDLRCAAPGIIREFNATEQTVKVQLAIKDAIYIDKLERVAIPELLDVPILPFRAGNFVITVPVTVGDECLVVFADSCIDAWWSEGEETTVPANKGTREALTNRRHDLSDGFAILAPSSQPKKIENYATDCLEIRTLDGINKIQVKDDEVKIVVNETTYISVKDGIIKMESSATIDLKSTGKTTIESSAAMDVKSTGDMKIQSSAKMDVKSTGTMNIEGSSTMDIKGTGNMKINGSAAVEVKGAGAVNVESSGGAVDVKGASVVTVDAPSIKLGGLSALYKLIDQRILTYYDGHQHLYTPGPGAPTLTGIPAVILTPLLTSIATQKVDGD
jgi:hypothetical protein